MRAYAYVCSTIGGGEEVPIDSLELDHASLCLFLLVWSDSQPSSINNVSMLYSYDAPMTTCAAST